MKKVGWVIIGAMTGPGSKFHQPRPEWVQAILNNVYVDNLLREHPEVMVWPEEGHR